MGGCMSEDRKPKTDQSRVNIQVSNSTNPNKSQVEQEGRNAITQSNIAINIPEDEETADQFMNRKPSNNKQNNQGHMQAVKAPN